MIVGIWKQSCACFTHPQQPQDNQNIKIILPFPNRLPSSSLHYPLYLNTTTSSPYYFSLNKMIIILPFQMLLLKSKHTTPSRPPPSLLSTISNNCRKHYSLASLSPPVQDPFIKVKTGAIVPGVSSVYALVKKNEEEKKERRKAEQRAGAARIAILLKRKKSEETLSKIKQDAKTKKNCAVVCQNIPHSAKLTFSSRRTSKKRIELKLPLLSMKLTSMKADFFSRLQLQSPPLKPYLVTVIMLLSRFERKQKERTVRYAWAALR